MERRSAGIPGTRFKTVAVVAGDDSRNALRMSASVRDQLSQAGLDAVRRSGRWADESDAVNDLCQPGREDPVDGVVFVFWDQVTLRDCETKVQAFHIAGSGTLGLPEMTERLIDYLRPASTP